MSKVLKEDVKSAGLVGAKLASAINLFEGWKMENDLSYLMGQVLTVIDASIEGERNVAVKSLIRNSFGDMQAWYQRKAWDESAGGDACSLGDHGIVRRK